MRPPTVLPIPRSRRLLIALRAIALAAVALLASCNHYKVVRFECFDDAMRALPVTGDPRVFDAASIPTDLPGWVSYCAVDGDFVHVDDPAYSAYLLKREILDQELAPDFIIYQDGGSSTSGYVGQHVGFGIVISQPVNRGRARAYCCRRAPVSTGILWDKETNMVLELTDLARSSGLQEGDIVVAISGRKVRAEGQKMARFDLAVLNLSVGQKVPIEWIRPGTGKMAGELVLADPAPLSAARSFVAEEEARAARMYGASEPASDFNTIGR